ncbi:MAG: hypothetical protein L0216_09760 [Planctomycetales bacterium]|nr:hypothetical protein [Planctomycetales bacterium]
MSEARAVAPPQPAPRRGFTWSDAAWALATAGAVIVLSALDARFRFSLVYLGGLVAWALLLARARGRVASVGLRAASCRSWMRLVWPHGMVAEQDRRLVLGAIRWVSLFVLAAMVFGLGVLFLMLTASPPDLFRGGELLSTFGIRDGRPLEWTYFVGLGFIAMGSLGSASFLWTPLEPGPGLAWSLSALALGSLAVALTLSIESAARQVAGTSLWSSAWPIVPLVTAGAVVGILLSIHGPAIRALDEASRLARGRRRASR